MIFYVLQNTNSTYYKVSSLIKHQNKEDQIYIYDNLLINYTKNTLRMV